VKESCTAPTLGPLAGGNQLRSSHAALSPQLLQPIAPPPTTTAHRISISSSALSDASMVSSNDQSSSKSPRFARDPAAPARKRTESNQHSVSCSMVDNMDVQDSAQRIASPRSQRSGSSTDGIPINQLSIRSTMCCVCVQPVRRPLQRVASQHAFGRLCLR
jgi:hypothetical protein